VDRPILRTALTLIALTAVLVTGGCDGSGTDTGPAAESTDVAVTVFVDLLRPEVAGSFEEGQQVRAKDSGAAIGTITGVEHGPAILAVPTAEGGLEAAESPIEDQVEVTIEGSARVTDSGLDFGGQYLHVGAELRFVTPFVSFEGVVVSLDGAQ
jgi:hypothetical protein